MTQDTAHMHLDERGLRRASLAIDSFCASKEVAADIAETAIRAYLQTAAAVAEREAEPVATVAEVFVDGKRLYNTTYPADALDKLPKGTLLYTSPSTSELEALRKRVAEIDAHRRKVLAENVRLLNALIERDRRVAELEKAVDGLLAPFEHDECRKDHHGYCQAHFLEEECCVATARRVREGGK